MPLIGYAELPVPAGSDAPAGSGQMAALAEAIDPHLAQHVTDAADRNTRLSDAPQWTLAIATNGTMWVKTSSVSNTWVTIWEPLPTWQAITPAAGYEGGAYPPQARRIGNQVFLRGRLQRTDSEAVIPNNGVKIGDVPTACIPQGQIGSIAACSSLAGDVVIGTGKLEVVDVNTSSGLGAPGSILWWSQDGTTGTPWVNISGSYWVD